VFTCVWWQVTHCVIPYGINPVALRCLREELYRLTLTSCFTYLQVRCFICWQVGKDTSGKAVSVTWVRKCIKSRQLVPR